MTIKEKILEHLRNNPKHSYSNFDLSKALAIPEPSVRRATNDLAKDHTVVSTISTPYRISHRTTV